MSLEFPNQNAEQHHEKNESSGTYFLRDQIRLPQEEWSPEFRATVDAAITEYQAWNEKRLRIRSGEETEAEESLEAERAETFHRYLEQLGMSESDLKGKRVMDIGYGDGNFVKHLVSAGITSEAYGIDIDPRNPVEKEFEGHLFKQSSEQELPVKDLDYIVSIRAIWHGWVGEDGYVMNVETVLEKALDALRDGGEMRIYPIEESTGAGEDASFEIEQQKQWDALLPRLSEKYGLKYSVEPRNVFATSRDGEVTLQSVLIIKK